MLKFIGVAVVCALLGVGCAGTTPKEVVNGGLQAAQVVCVIAHAELDVPAIAKACDIADVLIPDIQKIVDQFFLQRDAYVRAKAAKCVDGGAR